MPVSSSPRSRQSHTARPAGTRPPLPPIHGLVRGGVCVWLIVSCVLILTRDLMLDWAHSTLSLHVVASPMGDSSESLPTIIGSVVTDMNQSPTLVLARVAVWLSASRAFRVLTALCLGGLIMYGIEAMVAALLLVMQTHTLRRTQRTCLRIRLPVPPAIQTGMGSSSAMPSGAMFFRAIQDVLPRTAAGRFTGHAPWLACTLSGQPDQPVEVGIVVCDASPRRRAETVTKLRAIIQGQRPDAVVEETLDLLAAQCTQACTVMWRDMGMRLPSHVPLRALDDITGSDLLGPLLSALAPAGTRYTEVQISLRPAAGSTLHTGWRSAGTRLLMRLQQKADYALSADIKKLDAKLAATAFEASLRLVVVAAQTRQGRLQARSALAQMTAVLGQYAERISHHRQYLLPIQSGQVRVRTPVFRSTRGWRPGLASLAGCVSGGAIGCWIGYAGVAYQPVLLILLSGLGALLPLAWFRWRHGHSAADVCAKLWCRTPRCMPPPPVLAALRPWKAHAILTAIELAGLWHLPTPALGNLVAWLPCRYFPPPPHAFVDQQQGTSTGTTCTIIVGTARRSDGTIAPVGLTSRDVRQILHCSAGMGAGKSRLLANICQQLFPLGFVLIDGKGDDAGSLVPTVLRLISLDDERRVVVLDIKDTLWPVGLNPLAGVDLAQSGALDYVSAQIAAVFGRLDPETWGNAPGMKDYLDKATRLVLAAEQHPTLAHVKQALLDDSYRATLLTRCRNQDILDFWTMIYPQTSVQQKGSRDALLRRFDQMLTADLLRLMLVQPDPLFRFADAIRDRAIVLAPLPHIALGHLAGVASMLTFQLFLSAAFARPGDDQSRADYPIIVDEFQVLAQSGARADLEHAFSQLRSLGIPSIFAHQALAQIGDLDQLLLINAENRLLLKTREPDASVYARLYAHSGITAGDISGQDPREHQYAVLRCGGMPAGPFSLRPLDWPPPVVTTLPVYTGPPWQTIVPPDSPDPAFDREIMVLVYGRKRTTDALTSLAQALARLDACAWQRVLDRWQVIRRLHRQHIEQHPGCIPDQQERVRWRSRLAYATPAVLAEAGYRRIRRAIDPAPLTDASVPAASPHGRPGKHTASRTGSADTPGQERPAPHFAVADQDTPPPTIPVTPAPAFPRSDDDD